MIFLGDIPWDTDHPRDNDNPRDGGYPRDVDLHIICLVLLCDITRPHFILLLSTKLFLKLTGTDKRQTDIGIGRHAP